MADIFIEHLVVKKNTTKDYLKRALYSVAFVTLNALAFFLLPSLIPVTLVLGVWLLIILNRQLNLEFEYILTNGELDIDQISGQRKRKRLITLDCRTLEACGPVSDARYQNYKSNKYVKAIEASASVKASNRYFLVAPAKEGGRVLVHFDPSEKVLAAMQNFNRRAFAQ